MNVSPHSIYAFFLASVFQIGNDPGEYSLAGGVSESNHTENNYIAIPHKRAVSGHEPLLEALTIGTAIHSKAFLLQCMPVSLTRVRALQLNKIWSISRRLARRAVSLQVAERRTYYDYYDEPKLCSSFRLQTFFLLQEKTLTFSRRKTKNLYLSQLMNTLNNIMINLQLLYGCTYLLKAACEVYCDKFVLTWTSPCLSVAISVC